MTKTEAYSRSDYLPVVNGVLVRREKTSLELAEEIGLNFSAVGVVVAWFSTEFRM